MKRLRVCDRVIISHYARTIGSFRVLTVESLQRLKMKALIPESIEIHCQQCQACGYTRLDSQHISYRSLDGSCLTIIHPFTRTLSPVISIFSHTSISSCSDQRQRQHFQNDRVGDIVTVVPIPGDRFLRHSMQRGRRVIGISGSLIWSKTLMEVIFNHCGEFW